MTTLVAHNIFSPFSQEIDDLPFTFVTPLGAQYDDVVTHFQNHRLLKMDSTIAFQSYSTFCIQNKANPTTFDQPIDFLSMW
ncbi:hypothetical protein IE985_10910 [Klebsiella pneumoniae]|nr:hypothetical protein [Klebsiella pneumoniae]